MIWADSVFLLSSVPCRAPPGFLWSHTCPSGRSRECSWPLVGCGGAFAGSSSMSAARVFYTGQMTRQQCNNLPLISAGSNWLFFPLQDSCLCPSPAGGRVLQGPLHGRLIEGDRLSILNINGCRLEGEGVGVGCSPRQRDQGRRWTLLQLSFRQRQNDSLASYNIYIL